MRLIDADALFETMNRASWYNNADRDDVALELILKEPTVEPVKHGRWKGNGFGDYRCSWCDEVVSSKPNYCRNCGVKNK